MTARHNLPYNLDAEEAVIACCLRDGRLVAPLMDILPAQAMYTAGHKQILEAMYAIASQGETTTVITLVEMLRRRGDLGSALPKGDSQLMDMLDATASAVGLRGYARIVLEYWICRETILVTRDLHAKSWEVSADFPRQLGLMRALAEDLVRKTTHLERLAAAEAIR